MSFKNSLKYDIIKKELLLSDYYYTISFAKVFDVVVFDDVATVLKF